MEKVSDLYQDTEMYKRLAFERKEKKNIQFKSFGPFKEDLFKNEIKNEIEIERTRHSTNKRKQVENSHDG